MDRMPCSGAPLNTTPQHCYDVILGLQDPAAAAPAAPATPTPSLPLLAASMGAGKAWPPAQANGGAAASQRAEPAEGEANSGPAAPMPPAQPNGGSCCERGARLACSCVGLRSGPCVVSTAQIGMSVALGTSAKLQRMSVEAAQPGAPMPFWAHFAKAQRRVFGPQLHAVHPRSSPVWPISTLCWCESWVSVES